MDLADVEILVTVVDQGGFTAAARELGISKSYASKRIRALEERLGAALLTRTTRHVAPTVLGQAYVERARAALELLDEAEQIAAQERGVPSGHLKVSVPHSFGITYLAPIFAEFQAAWPDLVMEVTYTDRRVGMVEEGYDLAFRIANLDDSDLLARRVTTIERWLVASPAYLARKGEPTSVDDLAEHDFLIYTLTAEPYRVRLRTHEGAVTVPVRGRVVSDSGDALVVAATHGLGICVGPDWMVGAHVAAGRLVRLLRDQPTDTATLWAVYPRHRAHSPKVTRLVELVTKRLEPAAWRCPT